NLGGSLDAQAKLTASAITSAQGDTHGGTASIGVAFALTLATHTVESTTLRDITAVGSVGFQALGSSASESDASASAAGAPGEDSGDHTSSDAPDAQATQQRNYADSRAPASGDSGGAGATGSSDTSSGSVSVAAAVGINISTSSSKATIPTGIHITAGGAVTLKTSANSDSKAKGDGSAVTTGGSGVAVGAGVAVNVAHVHNEATAEAGSVISGQGFTADASMTNVSGDTTHRFGAETTSGASGGKVGIGASVSINIVDVHTTGAIRTGASVNAGAGAVLLGAASTSDTIVKALPAGGGVGGASVGVGASFALSVMDDTTFAGIEDGGTLTGGGNVTLLAVNVDTMTVDAKTGASSPKVSVAPAIAIALSNVTTSATIGTGAALNIGGTLDAKATERASALTTAAGDAIGASVAVGVALALTLANHKVFSTTTRNITAGGAISFQALGSSITGADTVAGADGAPSKSDNDSSGGGSVNDKGNQQLNFANSKSTGNGGDGAGSSETPKASTSDNSSDSVAVAAAISINIAKTTAQAILPNGLVLTAA
ncbi:MAG TPA: hypothetical protein VF327_04570, partial [Gaiellaceae bacterium]